MAGYTSIMVQAYSLATGKAIEESLSDLGVQELINPTEFNLKTPEEKLLISGLQNDQEGIKKWSCRS